MNRNIMQTSDEKKLKVKRFQKEEKSSNIALRDSAQMNPASFISVLFAMLVCRVICYICVTAVTCMLLFFTMPMIFCAVVDMLPYVRCYSDVLCHMTHTLFLAYGVSPICLTRGGPCQHGFMSGSKQ